MAKVENNKNHFPTGKNLFEQWYTLKAQSNDE